MIKTKKQWEIVRVRNRKNFKRSIPLLVMFLPVILYYAIFKFAPMGGLLMAFENYSLRKGIFGSDFVGFQNFKYIFNTPLMMQVIKNTLFLGI